MINLLVVDDEPDVQILFEQKFRREIKKSQLELEFALSAKAALEYLSSLKMSFPTLIISDLNMPGMSGLELLKIIKEQYRDLTVFMVTAYGDEDNYQKAMLYGADEYINKPINFNQLKQKIFNS